MMLDGIYDLRFTIYENKKAIPHGFTKWHEVSQRNQYVK